MKQHIRPFFSLYLGSLFIYCPLILLRLTNDMDGMWDQDDHVTGVAELRMGRWFWPILDKLRLNVSLDPLPALAALALFSCGILFLLSLMHVQWKSQREKLSAWVVGMMILSAPTLLCQLSYSHMSINDALSFLFAVLAVWIVERKTDSGRKLLWILAAGFVIALMMGGYQASLGITCVTALFCFISMLARSEKPEKALGFAGRMLASVVAGAVLYEVFLHLCLAVTGQTLSDYNGADTITFGGVIRALPSSLKHTYTAFDFFFGGGGYHFNILQSHNWFPVFYLIPAAILLSCMWSTWKRSRLSAVLMAAAFLLIPVFANSFFLLAVSAETMMQMTMGMAMILPLVFCLMPFCGHPDLQKERLRKLFYMGTGMGMALLLYGEIAQTVVDQYAMCVGRRAATTIAGQVMNQWAVTGTDYTENVVLVYGTPMKSPLFQATPLFNRANSFAQFGRWATTSEGNRLCWSAFFIQQLRVNVNYAEGDTLETIYNSPEVAAMPVYPAPGSTANVWGVTVVKISE